MWGRGLPITFFDGLALDGKGAALCRRVCKDWKHKIEKIERFVRYMYLHYVKIEDDKDFEKELSEHKLKDLVPSRMMSRLDNILYEQHKFNPHVSGVVIGTGHWGDENDYVRPQEIAVEFGWHGESSRSYVEAPTGDIVVINDYYSDIPNYETSHVDGMHVLQNEIFPGTFTWKLIETIRGKSNWLFDQERHRGSCFYLRYKKDHTKSSLVTGYAAKLRREARKRMREAKKIYFKGPHRTRNPPPPTPKLTPCEELFKRRKVDFKDQKKQNGVFY